MNNLTKISATALVALFLAACDKPAQKPAEPAKAETAPAAQTPAEPAKTEAAPAPAAQPEKAAETTTAAPSEAAKADFQKLVEWNAAQEQTMAAAQAELQQKLTSQDPKQIQEGLSAFNKKVEDTIKSLDAINVSDEQIKAFKEKTKSVLELSSDVLSSQVKVMTTPNDASLVETIQKKSEALIGASTELQKLNAELQQRFMAK